MHHHQLFNDKADVYQRARPTYPKALFEYLSQLTSSQDSQLPRTVWDCACGNGQAAIGLAHLYDHVVATDVSAEQIANAMSHPKIDYSVCKSEKTKLANESIDLITVAQALHWFDLSLFWPEVDRVLKPGGVFTAFGYNFPKISSELDQLYQTKILDVVDSFWAPNNRLLWDEYQAIEFPFIEQNAPDIKIQVNWGLQELFDFFHTFSAVRRYIDAYGDAFFKDAYESFKVLWGDANNHQKISFKLVLYAGRKMPSEKHD